MRKVRRPVGCENFLLLAGPKFIADLFTIRLEIKTYGESCSEALQERFAILDADHRLNNPSVRLSKRRTTMPPNDFPITSDIAEIKRAGRAIVYLWVEWSGPERLARKIVQSAIESLPDFGFEFFAVEEDSPLTGAWLTSFGWQHPRGCGSLMWFEAGRRVHTELLPGKLGAEAIIRKTLTLWG